MCSTSGLLSLGLAILLAALVGVRVVWRETRAERKAWRDPMEEYWADEAVFREREGSDR